MTREESLKLASYEETPYYYQRLINKIYDKFESQIEQLENRSCSNCKHNKKQDSFMIFCNCVMCEDGSKMMWHSFTKYFCCNKWENKQ